MDYLVRLPIQRQSRIIKLINIQQLTNSIHHIRSSSSSSLLLSSPKPFLTTTAFDSTLVIPTPTFSSYPHFLRTSSSPASSRFRNLLSQLTQLRSNSLRKRYSNHLNPTHNSRAFTSSILRCHPNRAQHHSHPKRWSRYSKILIGLTITLVFGKILYEFLPSFRYAVVGLVRCTRVTVAVIGAIWDYKLLFKKTWEDDSVGRATRHLDYQTTHLKAATRILNVLKKNGGIYVKLGQHLSSIQLVPLAWSSTMRPLQDQCTPSSKDLINRLFLEDLGLSISDLFESFDPIPIGVASLAQVHKAVDRQTGRPVAVKVMHPSLEEYLTIDTRTVVVMLKFVKWVFPEFEFTWLGEEMEENLPKEMDFRIEANNALKCRQQFSTLKSTTLKIPDVIWSRKRILVMEYITGGRFDDLEYLENHNIDRNRASQELTRIFSQMIYLNGYFHADPHAGNLLIRPAPKMSRSEYNFEIVLLDHGLYFELEEELRVNYARFWISLLDSKEASVKDRKKYARLVGNIEESNYDLFESAITGRIGLKGHGSLMNISTSLSSDEQKLIQLALVSQDNIFSDILKILRNVPRRLLMILKVNDLTRSLDLSLNTTHSQVRIWLIVARFCSLAIWLDELKKIKSDLFHHYHQHHHQFLQSFQSLFSLYRCFFLAWIHYQKWYNGLRLIEFGMDFYANLRGLLYICLRPKSLLDH